MLLNIFHQEQIILRHLTAYNVMALIVGAADDTSLQQAVGRNFKMLDLQGDPCTLCCGKERSIGGKSKSVSADIVQLAGKLLSGFRDSDETVIIDIHTRIFTTVIDLWTGTDLYLIDAVIIREDLCFIPAVKDIAYGNLHMAWRCF